MKNCDLSGIENELDNLYRLIERRTLAYLILKVSKDEDRCYEDAYNSVSQLLKGIDRKLKKESEK